MRDAKVPVVDRPPGDGPRIGPREDAASGHAALHRHLELPFKNLGLAPFALGIACSTLGVIGGLYLAKFLIGLSADFRTQELLVRYHDRLRELVGDDLK